MIWVLLDMMLYRWVNMKAPGSFETSGITHTTTRRRMPEDLNPQYHRCEHKPSHHRLYDDTLNADSIWPVAMRNRSGVWDNRERTAARCDKPRVGIRRTEDTEWRQWPERSVVAAVLST